MDILILLSATAIIAFLVSYTSIPSLIKVAEQKHLYDEPDTDRKFHRSRIPTLGGIAIFGGMVISSSLIIDFSKFPSFGYALSAIILLFFTGVKDDIIPLTPFKKLVAQILASIIVVVKCDIRFTSLYGFLWLDDISYPVSIGISIFTLLVIINSFNLIDGINGLAGGIGIIVSLTFGYFFFITNNIQWVVLTVALAGALLGFLCFNFSNKAKIFMGDTGSLMIGLLSGMFCIKFIELNKEIGFLLEAPFAPVFAFAILIVPLFDTLRVFVIRLVHKKSPFSGDRNHLHHLLVDSGLNHCQASGLLYLINFAFIFTSLLFQNTYQIISLSFILGTATVMSGLLFYYKITRHPILYVQKPQPLPNQIPLKATNKAYLKKELSSK
jgi:UDP-GlcNAc:undecaprenyl-phosphate/decaprenyl-phosphate GlcNAc-1-phosphate transferase